MLAVMTAIADRYRHLSARLTELVGSVPSLAWANPSPCEGWSAREVVGHLVETEAAMLDRVALNPGDILDLSDTFTAWPAVSALIQQALDNPAKAATTYDGFFGPTTFEATIDQFYSFDLVVHTWDIARATGQLSYEAISAEEIERATAAVAAFGDNARVPGILGPEVAVGPDADAQTRLIGLLGRHP